VPAQHDHDIDKYDVDEHDLSINKYDVDKYDHDTAEHDDNDDAPAADRWVPDRGDHGCACRMDAPHGVDQ
jgi:hypothetical protein